MAAAAIVVVVVVVVADSGLDSADRGNWPSAPPPAPSPPAAAPCKGSVCPIPEIPAVADAVDMDVVDVAAVAAATVKFGRDAENEELSDILVEWIKEEPNSDRVEDEDEDSCPDRCSVDPRPLVLLLLSDDFEQVVEDEDSCVLLVWMDGGKIS